MTYTPEQEKDFAAFDLEYMPEVIFSQNSKTGKISQYYETLLSNVIIYLLTTMAQSEIISLEKKDVIRNLYLSGIGEEFIAMQLDIEIPDVIKVLKELDVYKSPN